jgi:hypothetical protein
VRRTVRNPDSATLHRAHARWVTGEIGFSLLQKKFYTTNPIVETLNEGDAHPTSSTEVEENENRE